MSLLRISSKRSLHLVSLASLFFTSFPSFFFHCRCLSVHYFFLSAVLRIIYTAPSVIRFPLLSVLFRLFLPSTPFCPFYTFLDCIVFLPVISSVNLVLTLFDRVLSIFVLMIFLSSISFRVFSLIMQGLPFKRVRWLWPFLDCTDLL